MILKQSMSVPHEHEESQEVFPRFKRYIMITTLPELVAKHGADTKRNPPPARPMLHCHPTRT
jgi:hypothetical protein